MTKHRTNQATATRPGQPVQLCLPLEASDLMAYLAQQIDRLVRPAETPLIIVHKVQPTSDPVSRAPRARTHRAQEGRIYRGRYVDMTGKLRDVPNLCAITIMGIATAKYALNPAIPLNADDFATIAEQASVYRNETGVGAPYICAQTAEFILRVLRRIGLTKEQLSILTAPNVAELIDRFIQLHALDLEITGPLATAGGA